MDATLNTSRFSLIRNEIRLDFLDGFDLFWQICDFFANQFVHDYLSSSHLLVSGFARL